MSERDSRCFIIDVDGEEVRIQGDPNPSPEARKALVQIIRIARKHKVSLSEITVGEQERRIREVRKRSGLDV